MIKKIFLILYIICAAIQIFFPPLCLAKETTKSDIRTKKINEEWLGIYFKGFKLGFLHSSVIETKKIYTIKIVSFIKTKGFGAEQIISYRQESTMNKDFKTSSFVLIQQINDKEQKITGTVKDNKMHIETITAGDVYTKSVDFASNTYLSSDVMLMIVKKGLQVGQSYNVNILIESLQTVLPIEIKISGKETILNGEDKEDTFVIEETINGLTSKMWVKPNGDTIRQVSFEGFEILREDKSKAMEFKNGKVPTTSLINLSVIKAPSSIKNAFGLKKLGLEISLNAQYPFIEDHRQKINNRVSKKKFGLIIQKEDKTDAHFKNTFPIKDANLNPYLSENHIIQSKHQDIVKKALDIVGDEKIIWVAAQKINKWVYRYMKKVPVDTFSAVDALNSGKGECQSHTNLFTALARSVGIPVKIITGMVYSPYYSGFIYHSWPEVYIGEWIAIDPTLGEEIADATHIKLSEAENGNELEILKFLGNMQIQVKEYSN